jgi:tetratricopeptide (TPR) repeat protein
MLLMLLTACYGPQRRQMLALLDEADSLNRAYAQLPSDTLLRQAADFFDRHGTPNEQVRAHYLLGCAYRDMGEAPRAIDCFLEAAAKADTTAADCDFRRLCCVYSQMGNVYYHQMLLSNALYARRQAQHYAELAGDTLGAISSLKLSASVYILQNKPDSAETILRKAVALYNAHGYIQGGILSSVMLMHLLVDQPSRLPELKELIDKYDNESELFDSRHELPPSKRQFYYYKGKYFEATNQLDSAEHYYRKIYRPNMSYMEYAPLYSGLLGVYQKRHQGDSIAKYAQLYCMVNDSSVALKDQDITAQMGASYQYSRFQKEAFDNATKVYHFRLTLIISSLIFMAVLAIGTFWVRSYAKRQKEKRRLLEIQHKKESERLRREYEQEKEILQEYQEQKQRELEARQQVIALIQKELEAAKKDVAGYQDKYNESLQSIHVISSDKAALSERIRDLERQLESNIQDRDAESNWSVMKDYADSAIVLQIQNKAESQKGKLTKKEMHELVKATAQYIPQLVRDLNAVHSVSQQKMCVCILTALNVRPGDIVRLLDVSPSIVSNCKCDLNTSLFGDDGASRLHTNLLQRYPVLAFFLSKER